MGESCIQQGNNKVIWKALQDCGLHGLCAQDGQCACSEVLSISTVSNCKLFNCCNMLNNNDCGWLWCVVVMESLSFRIFLEAINNTVVTSWCFWEQNAQIMLPRWRVERQKLPRAAPMSRGDASMQWSGRVSFWWHMQAGYAMQREFAKEPTQRCSSLSISSNSESTLRGSYRRC